MIPKTIHYCWFGRNPKPKLAKKCIRSWKKYCPDYTIVEWNEDNYDISSAPLYVRQAYEAKKWAFVTDYVRLDVVYRNGGIYLDTDVEVLRSLDCFLNNKVFFGLQSAQYVATGLGFGAEKDSLILAELMADYQNTPFILPDGSIDQTPCPQRNRHIFQKYGLSDENCEQLLNNEIHIYPTDFFSPKDYHDGKLKRTSNTVTIHWFAASWKTKEELKAFCRSQHKEHAKRFMHTMFGDYLYEKGKKYIRYWRVTKSSKRNHL